MKSYFYGVYLEDRTLASAFDVIRFLMEPDAIRFSHITIRGPYQTRNALAAAKALASKVHTWSVTLGEPDCFFSKSQSTVFLQVELGQLRTLWHKPNYPQGIPHLTLYDGTDRRSAEMLQTVLSRHKWDIRTPVTRLRPIDEKAKIEGSLFELLSGFMDGYANYLGSLHVAPSEVARMEIGERIDLVQLVLVKAGMALSSGSSSSHIKRRFLGRPRQRTQKRAMDLSKHSIRSLL